MFRRKPQRGKYYWCCIKHDENREKCHITPITEQSIYEAFRRLYYKLKHQSLPVLERMLETLRTIRDRRLLWSEDIVSLNKKYPNSPVRIKRWPSSSKTASLILTFLYPKATN